MTVRLHVLHNSGFVDLGYGDCGDRERCGEMQANYPGQPRDEKGQFASGFSLRFDPNLRSEAEFRTGGEIIIGPKFKELSPEAQTATLAHEIGHQLSDEMLKDGTAFELADSGAFGPKAKDGTILGINGQYTPGENVAEAYSVLTTEPKWLKEHYPAAHDSVLSRAKSSGYPTDPDEMKKVISKITGKPNPQVNYPGQPRDEDGRWTSGGKFYRGSSYSAAMSIRNDGIKGQSWYGRGPSVYITKTREEAEAYAQLNTPQGKSCVITEIEVPKSAKVIRDEVDNEGWGASTAYRIPGDVPKEWVKKCTVYKDGEKIFTYDEGGVGERYFHVQLCLDKDNPQLNYPGQPRDERGRWSETGHSDGSVPQAEVYVTKDDLKEVTSFGGEKIFIHKESGETFRGKMLDIDDLPDTLYHMTTNAEAVKLSGKLTSMHGDDAGGLGKGTSMAHRGVSLTTDHQTAEMMRNELLRYGKIARGEVDVRTKLKDWASEDEKTSGLGKGKLDPAVRQATGWLDAHGEHASKPSYMKDAMNQYYFKRESLGGPENPIIFGDIGNFAHITSSSTKVLAIPKSKIPKRALIRDPKIGLNEIMVHGEIPLGDGVQYNSEFHMVKGKWDIPQVNYPGQPRDKNGKWTGNGTGFSSVTSKKEIAEVKKEVSSWGGERGRIGKFAVDGHSPGGPDGTNLHIFRDNGKIKAVCLFESYEGNTQIHCLATAEKGYGTSMIRTVAAKASSVGEGLRLYATPSAASFYKALGFKRGRSMNDLFILGKKATKRLASSVKSYSETSNNPRVIFDENELINLEPDNGVFAVRGGTYHLAANFDPSQPRDEDGKWTDTGRGSRTKTRAEMTPEEAKADAKRCENEKWARLDSFTADHSGIMNKVNSDFDRSEEAKVLTLINRTGFRVGGQRVRGEEQVYGASTLLAKQVKVTGDQINFDFLGKHAIPQSHSITDQKLATMIEKRKSGLKPDDRLFDTNDGRVRRYLKRASGKNYLVKDFRTYVATTSASKMVAAMPKPENVNAAKKARMQVCTAVSRILGNSPNMAKNSYIHPRVWREWGLGE